MTKTLAEERDNILISNGLGSSEFEKLAFTLGARWAFNSSVVKEMERLLSHPPCVCKQCSALKLLNDVRGDK